MNDRGTVLQGAKYDFEVVECTEPYTAVIELPDCPAEKEPSHSQEPESVILERALQEIVRHGVSFGARTTRGYGQMRAEIRRREFVLPDAMDDWLAFDPLDAEHFGGDKLTEGDAADTAALYIRANLKMDGSFSVRRYLSKLPQTAENQKETRNQGHIRGGSARTGPILPSAGRQGCRVLYRPFPGRGQRPCYGASGTVRLDAESAGKPAGTACISERRGVLGA